VLLSNCQLVPRYGLVRARALQGAAARRVRWLQLQLRACLAVGLYKLTHSLKGTWFQPLNL
jgi:hypothetical protein